MLTVKKKIDVEVYKGKSEIQHTAPLPRDNRDYHVIKNIHCTHNQLFLQLASFKINNMCERFSILKVQKYVIIFHGL